MSKVVEYVGWFHTLRDRLKENWTQFWHSTSEEGGGGGEEKETNFRAKIKDKLEKLSQRTITRINHSSTSDDDDFSHLTRPKTRSELLKISAAVMGIEFAYAAETAFVSPLLLNIGLRHRHMTLMWCLSPLLGFFVTPILGSLSDGCHSRLGKRRPFIILLSIGIVLGLILVPNGQTIGRLLGDVYKDDIPIQMVVDDRYVENTKSSASSDTVAGLNSKYGTIATETTTAESISVLDKRKKEKRLDDKLENLNSTASLNPLEIRLPILSSDSESASASWSYKHSPRHWALDERSGRRRNYMTNPLIDEREQQDNLKKFNRNPINKRKEDKLENVFMETLFEMSQNENENGNGEQDSNNGTTTDDDFNASSLKLSTLENGGQKPTVSSLSSSNEKNRDDGSNNLNNGSSTGKNRKPVQKPKLKMTPEEAEEESIKNERDSIANHPWGLVFTVIGTVLLDFDADACQSPSRAYMLDVTIPEDHARGLSAFTVMAGLGGTCGYFLGAVNWESTLGTLFGGQVRAVFTLVLFIFIACVITTIRSFREIPIDRLYGNKPTDRGDVGTYSRFEEDPNPGINGAPKKYGATDTVVLQQQETSFNENLDSNNISRVPSYLAEREIPIPVAGVAVVGEGEAPPTFREYVKTIVQMPKSLQWLCLTNFFCWMSLVCYSLYFTDFVGEAVFDGDPSAPVGSTSRINYDNGVRFGCWGMSLYSLSCSIYSLGIERLVQRFGAKRVYICGQLVYSIGMIFMAIFRHPAGVIIFSWTAGIMYATLFTMPYLLVARYHAADTFDVDVDDIVRKPSQMRGLGTDVAIVSSMVFLAQMTQALVLGNVVAATGSTTAIVIAASLFSMCGALSATRVLSYLQEWRNRRFRLSYMWFLVIYTVFYDCPRFIVRHSCG